ncbi:hypothetical protein BDV95DRAFT_42328 [Massariosphaeria phaeospora]|uniref:Uncharacterized protein n=1 Tax=Massariosphaeria phaeospora TaxID=100035 RepID=A0A7C8I9J6_9PLEO|nr:hypothetical protein BDV95DRAFT_42328 [Massariosphaeria phaeospora]
MSRELFSQSTPIDAFSSLEMDSRKHDGFVALGHDIHHLILTELVETSRSSLLALAQVSHLLYGITTPYVYCNLVLARGVVAQRPRGAENEHLTLDGRQPSLQTKPRRAYYNLLDRIRQDTGDKIVKHVRHIRVEDTIPSEELLVVLGKVQNLRQFSWHANQTISQLVLDKLQTTWPKLKLFVRRSRRHHAEEGHRSIDFPLLSSPQLDTLACTVYIKDNVPQAELTQSEWPQLTRAIVAGAHCRILRLRLRKDQYFYNEPKVLKGTEEHAVPRFSDTSTMRLPPLEEIQILTGRFYTRYPWDMSHCLQLRNCMDCSRIRVLDFSRDYPRAFFSAFTGELPNLQSLCFGLPGPYGQQDESVQDVVRFLDSCIGLKALDISRLASRADEMWPAVLRHKDTLEELVLRPTIGYWITPGSGRPEYLDTRYLQQITEEFPRLERLGFDVPFCDPQIGVRKSKKPKKDSPQVDPAYLALLTTLRLRRLDLFLYLPTAATPFAAGLDQNATGTIPHPELNAKALQSYAMDLADRISAAQKRPLQTLTMHLARTGFEDRAQPYLMEGEFQIRRSERDDAEMMGEAKWTVEGKCSWDHFLDDETN